MYQYLHHSDSLHFLQSERRAERLSRARRPQFGGKRRRPPPRIQKHPKENDCFTTAEEIRCSTPPHFEYVVVQNSRSKYFYLYKACCNIVYFKVYFPLKKLLRESKWSEDPNR